jgi:membrane protease YdiL (CAAX protease family)
MTIETAKGGSSAAPTAASRRRVALQLLGLLALCALLIPAISPTAAVAHGAVIKILFLARILVLLGVATWFLRLQHRSWCETGLRKPRLWKTLLCIPLGAIASAICVGAVTAAAYRIGARAADYSMFSPLQGKLGEYLFWAFPVTWGTAAFGEELLFRGFVLSSIETVFGGRGRLVTGGAIVLQAVLFGALHFYQGPGGVATAATIGLILGVMWLLTERNLWAGIAIHGLFDFAAMTAIYFGAMPQH